MCIKKVDLELTFGHVTSRYGLLTPLKVGGRNNLELQMSNQNFFFSPKQMGIQLSKRFEIKEKDLEPNFGFNKKKIKSGKKSAPIPDPYMF